MSKVINVADLVGVDFDTLSLDEIQAIIEDHELNIIQLQGLNPTEEIENAINQRASALVDLRGHLIEKYSSIINTIEGLTESIKGLNLPTGTYGRKFELKVTQTTTSKVVDNQVVYDHIVERGHNPLDFFRLNLSDPFIKYVISEHPEFVVKSPASNKHTFKAKNK